ncbi:MAG: hypothetical protein ACI363_10600 [Phocaeicola plebeius]
MTLMTKGCLTTTLSFFATNDETVGADLCVCPETPTSVFRADTQVRPYSVIIE